MARNVGGGTRNHESRTEGSSFALLDRSEADLTCVQDYSAILIIPDLYDQVYVREMTELILGSIGFKQMCMQQVRSPRSSRCSH